MVRMTGIVTAIGLVIGISFMILAILIGKGSMVTFVSPLSALIVFGGSFAAVLVSFSTEQIANSFKSLKYVFFPKTFPYKETIDQIYNMAIITRKEGIPGLETEAVRLQAENHYLSEIADLASVTPEVEVLRELVEARILALKKQNKSNEEVFRKMGGYAPAFGMAGTLIGLIMMLAKLQQPEIIGPSMAVALITTLYGVLAANLILLPLASKIAGQSLREADYSQMLVEGIMRVASGETPARIVEKLKTMAPPEEAEKVNIGNPPPIPPPSNDEELVPVPVGGAG